MSLKSKRIVDPRSAGASTIFTSGIVLANSCMRTSCRSRIILAFLYGEAFGTAGKGSPASRFFTSPARKSAKGAISPPTLAFSRAFT